MALDPQDLVIPMWKMPGHFRTSPLVGAAPRERKFLLSFIGDMGTHRFPYYSRGIRQTLYTKGKVGSCNLCCSWPVLETLADHSMMSCLVLATHARETAQVQFWVQVGAYPAP